MYRCTYRRAYAPRDPLVPLNFVTVCVKDPPPLAVEISTEFSLRIKKFSVQVSHKRNTRRTSPFDIHTLSPSPHYKKISIQTFYKKGGTFFNTVRHTLTLHPLS